MALRWLADLVQPSVQPPMQPPAPAGAPVVVAARRLGAKLALALQLDQVEVVGIDMVNAAMNEQLSLHALPQAAALRVEGREDDGFAESVVAGIARACRAHDLPLTVQLAVCSNDEDVGIVLSGVVRPSPRFEPVAGDVVLALRGTGPTDRDHELMVEATRRRGLPFDARLPSGETLGDALIAPRRSHDSVLHQPITLGWPFAATTVENGGISERVLALLPKTLDVEWNLEALVPLPPYAASPDETAHTCSLGHDFVVVVHAADARHFEEHFADWAEPATRIGVVVVRVDPTG